MKRFRLFTGNRLETLVEMLSDRLTAPLSSPLTPEIIVVQSRGMERWLRLELARIRGVSAHLRFPFPNAFIHDFLFRKIVPELPETAPYDPKKMAWQIMKRLPESVMHPDFTELKTFLGDETAGLKAYQLSVRIADLFDQYQIFRPGWITRWERKKTKGWQPDLWRRLSAENGPLHRAALSEMMIRTLKDSPVPIPDLPERISVFGVSTLPRFHMDILDALSYRAEVSLFLMNPCAEYWGDMVSRKERKRILRKGAEKGVAESDLHMGGANALLTSMGILGRDFFDLIQEYETETSELFESPNGENLLSRIQNEIVQGWEFPDAEKQPVAVSDTSVRIHSCHSPMREMEVLYENILSMFDDDPDLSPSGILVMMPDVEAYAPFVQAVFDAPGDQMPKIPFRIADRGFRSESRAADTFFKILDAAGGRFSAEEIVSVIESPPVRLCFHFTETQLESIREWIRDTRIRWGKDARHREEMRLPSVSQNTWRAGLRRMFSGYAMTGSPERLYQGILPGFPVEGDSTDLLGRLAEFLERLFRLSDTVSRPHTLEQWAKLLKPVPDMFFASEDTDEGEIRPLHDAVRELETLASESGFASPVDFRVIRAHFERQLSVNPSGGGFISGGVTFCAMLPMRSIPFDVICLAGLDSDAYPRTGTLPGFDLIAQNPEPGDRSRRNDDRYLFLETVLSARKKLYISYVGQSIRDNSSIPPSVLVSELTDYIQNGFFVPDGGHIIEDHLLTRHSLQAFSPVHFTESAADRGSLFSYSEDSLRTASVLVSPKSPPLPFIRDRLEAPGGEWNRVEIGDLCSFFKNPAKFFLTRRLSVFLDDADESLEIKEPFELNGLDRYRLADPLLERCLSGRDPETALEVCRAGGDLPHGAVGNHLFEMLYDDIRIFADRLKPYISEPLQEPVPIDIRIGKYSLRGDIRALFPERHIRYRFARIKSKDLMTAWLCHLSLQAALQQDAAEVFPDGTLIAGTDIFWKILLITDSARIENFLMRYLDIFMEGLQRPIPFFPESSMKYADAIINNGKTSEQAMKTAADQWEPGWDRPGEKENAYYQRCFSHEYPLDDEFGRIAVSLFEPLLMHLEKMD